MDYQPLNFRRFCPRPPFGHGLASVVSGHLGLAWIQHRARLGSVVWHRGSSPDLGLFGWISGFVGWGWGDVAGIRWRGYPGGSVHGMLKVLLLFFVIYIFLYMLTYCYNLCKQIKDVFCSVLLFPHVLQYLRTLNIVWSLVRRRNMANYSKTVRCGCGLVVVIL